MSEPDIRNLCVSLLTPSNEEHYGRLQPQGRRRVGARQQTVAEAAERIEKEIPEFIKYLNDEVVPAVRQHSTKALRVASEKLSEFADYMEKNPHPPK